MKAFDLVLSVLVETLLLLPSATSSSPTIVVDPKGLGFRVLRGGNSSDDHDFMDFVITAITEMDADGVPVGVGMSPAHSVISFGNLSTAGGERGVDQGGLEEASVSAVIMQGSAVVTLSAFSSWEDESSSGIEVGDEAVRLDVLISDWPFCTPFGHNGGRACLTEAQDILLENEGALPARPAPPPPHTLLIPRCDSDTVATFRFVCDPRLPVCTDLTSVKFYLGEADQPAGQAPNTATIGGNGSTALAQFEDSGVYEHNLTRAEVGGFLNVTSLTPGRDYVFWSVWEHGNGSAPESNSRDFDLSRVQYWQCPGTMIARNFEVGASLSVSFVVNGSAPLTTVCDDTLSNAGQRVNGGSTSSDSSSSTATAGTGARKLDALPPAQSRRLLDQNRTSFNQTQCTREDEDDENGSWLWGEGGAAFALGEYSRIVFDGHAFLDETRTSLAQGGSSANAEGEVTASFGSFQSQMVYSTLLFFREIEALGGVSAREKNEETATWVAIAFGLFMLWLLGCCTMRLAKDSNSARTWPAAIARARARSKGALADDPAGSFGSCSDSDFDSATDIKELQIFPMATKPVGTHSRCPTSPSWPPAAAPIAGWTTPGSVRSKSQAKIGSPPPEAFPTSDVPPLDIVEPRSPQAAGEPDAHEVVQV